VKNKSVQVNRAGEVNLKANNILQEHN